MTLKQLLEILNKGIARELQVSIQYMWQHVQVTGVMGAVVADKFKEIAITEMKHAEELAERLSYLNGVPTTKPDPIFVGNSLREMLIQDQKNEPEEDNQAEEDGDQDDFRYSGTRIQSIPDSE